MWRMKTIKISASKYWKKHEECFNSYSDEFPDTNRFLEEEFLPRGQQMLDRFQQSGVIGVSWGTASSELFPLDFEWLYDIPFGRTFCLIVYRHEVFFRISNWLPSVLEFLGMFPRYQIIMSTDFPSPDPLEDGIMIIRPDAIYWSLVGKDESQPKAIIDFSMDDITGNCAELMNYLFGVETNSMVQRPI